MTRYLNPALTCRIGLIVVLLAASVRADVDYWTTGVSNFWTAGDWSLGHAPFTTDLAVFDQPATYNVIFDAAVGDKMINSLWVAGGDVTLRTLSGPTRTLTVVSPNYVYNNATLRLDNFVMNLNGAPINVNGGTLNVLSGGLNAGHSITVGNVAPGTLLVDGSASSATATASVSRWGWEGGQANVTFSGGATGTFGQIDLAAGSIAGTTSNVNVLSGAHLNTGTLFLAANGGSTTSATLSIQGSGSSVTQSGASTLTVGHSSSGSAVINIGTTASGGTLTTGTGQMTINKTGTVTIGSGANAGILYANGNVLIDGGVLSSNNTVSYFVLVAGKTMTIQNGGRASITGQYYTLENTTYNITGGSSKLENLGGNLTIAQGGQVSVSNGGLLSSAYSIDIGIVSPGTLTVDGSGSSATAPIGGVSTWGEFGGGTASITFSNGATGTFGFVDMARGTTSGTAATLNVQSGASVSFSGELTLAESNSTGMSATMNINGTGSRVSQTGASVLVVGNGSTSPAAINIGTTASGGTLTTGTGTVTINKTGTVTVGSSSTTGSLIANGNVTMDGGLLQVNSGSGVLVASGKTMTLSNAGTLKGSGNVFGNVVNGGVVAPGLSPGTLPINGNYTQNSTGVLQIELSSIASFDRLLVSGTATLDGTLAVSLIDGFIPTGGNTFDILDWGTRSGTFATLQLPTLTGGLQWNTSQLYASGVLSVGIPGDYNLNGKVDAADYVLWRKSPSTYGGNPTGYNTWRANFGQTAGSGFTSNVPVPEPSSELLLLSLLAVAPWIRRPFMP